MCIALCSTPPFHYVINHSAKKTTARHISGCIDMQPLCVFLQMCRFSHAVIWYWNVTSPTRRLHAPGLDLAVCLRQGARILTDAHTHTYPHISYCNACSCCIYNLCNILYTTTLCVRSHTITHCHRMAYCTRLHHCMPSCITPTCTLPYNIVSHHTMLYYDTLYHDATHTHTYL